MRAGHGQSVPVAAAAAKRRAGQTSIPSEERFPTPRIPNRKKLCPGGSISRS